MCHICLCIILSFDCFLRVSFVSWYRERFADRRKTTKRGNENKSILKISRRVLQSFRWKIRAKGGCLSYVVVLYRRSIITVSRCKSCSTSTDWRRPLLFGYQRQRAIDDLWHSIYTPPMFEVVALDWAAAVVVVVAIYVGWYRFFYFPFRTRLHVTFHNQPRPGALCKRWYASVSCRVFIGLSLHTMM